MTFGNILAIVIGIVVCYLAYAFVRTQVFKRSTKPFSYNKMNPPSQPPRFPPLNQSQRTGGSKGKNPSSRL